MLHTYKILTILMDEHFQASPVFFNVHEKLKLYVSSPDLQVSNTVYTFRKTKIRMSVLLLLSTVQRSWQVSVASAMLFSNIFSCYQDYAHVIHDGGLKFRSF